jgi:hypothetical protein
MSVEIIFRNRTQKIERAEVKIDNKTFVFTGKEAKELAKLANSDKSGIKNYIESLYENTNSM